MPIVQIITEFAIRNPMPCSGDNYEDLRDRQGPLYTCITLSFKRKSKLHIIFI